MTVAASAVERARSAFASVAEFEAAVERDPHDRSLQINLLAARKAARQAQERLFELAEREHVEVCSYRLVPTGWPK